ncbi:tetraacyldisaccharide 4'-kinase [Sessilibacter sp. MAH1]
MSGIKTWLEKAVNASWYGRIPWTYALKPLEYLSHHHISKRRRLRKSPQKGPIIVVVGNITVGGTGKTPILISLAKSLHKAGLRVGIVARGYGGSNDRYPLQVTENTSVTQCGDEAKLLAMATGCDVWVDPKRRRALEALLSNSSVDVVLSDDGLQHYELERDIEVCVIDGQRGFGNQQCLPTGPLREPLDRLSDVDFIVINGNQGAVDNFKERYSVESYLNNRDLHCATIQPNTFIALKSGDSIPLKEFPRLKTYSAVTGIGNPQRFFDTLSSLSISYNEHIFPDHYRYQKKDFATLHSPILMTEKDAVKCLGFAEEDWFYLNVYASFSTPFFDHLVTKIQALQSSRGR